MLQTVNYSLSIGNLWNCSMTCSRNDAYCCGEWTSTSLHNLQEMPRAIFLIRKFANVGKDFKFRRRLEWSGDPTWPTLRQSEKILSYESYIRCFSYTTILYLEWWFGVYAPMKAYLWWSLVIDLPSCSAWTSVSLDPFRMSWLPAQVGGCFGNNDQAGGNR